VKQIASAILEIMKDCKKIEKDGTNAFHKYKYSSEAHVVAVIRASMIKHGVIIIPSVENYLVEDTMTTIQFKYRWIHVDSGEELETMTVGQGIDKGDKGAYKAITGANKYMLMKTLQLSTDDDPEADATTDKIANADPGEVPVGDREGFTPKETAIAKKRSKCAYCDNGSHIEPGDQLVISTYGKDNKQTWGHRVCWFNLKAGE